MVLHEMLFERKEVDMNWERVCMKFFQNAFYELPNYPPPGSSWAELLASILRKVVPWWLGFLLLFVVPCLISAHPEKVNREAISVLLLSVAPAVLLCFMFLFMFVAGRLGTMMQKIPVWTVVLAADHSVVLFSGEEKKAVWSSEVPKDSREVSYRSCAWEHLRKFEEVQLGTLPLQSRYLLRLFGTPQAAAHFVACGGEEAFRKRFDEALTKALQVCIAQNQYLWSKDMDALQQAKGMLAAMQPFLEKEQIQEIKVWFWLGADFSAFKQCCLA